MLFDIFYLTSPNFIGYNFFFLYLFLLRIDACIMLLFWFMLFKWFEYVAFILVISSIISSIISELTYLLLFSLIKPTYNDFSYLFSISLYFWCVDVIVLESRRLFKAKLDVWSNEWIIFLFTKGCNKFRC